MTTHTIPLSDTNIIWVDCEMTGLNDEKDRLLEVAVLVSDKDLQNIVKGPDLVIKQSDDMLANMGDWCKEHHGKSGLTEAVRNSRLTESEVDAQLWSFVQQYTPPGRCPIAGNSIQQDLRWLRPWCPRFTAHLHHRIIDVSTVKGLAQRWYPNEYGQVKSKKIADLGNSAHRAMADILASIDELRLYRELIFK